MFNFVNLKKVPYNTLFGVPSTNTIPCNCMMRLLHALLLVSNLVT